MYNNTETEQLIKFAKSLKKSLTIKYISSKEEAGFIYLNFEVKAQNLKNFDGFLSLYREGVLGFQPEGIGKLIKVSNGVSRITFVINKSADLSLFDDDKNSFYAIIAVDGISSKTENFKLKKFISDKCFCNRDFTVEEFKDVIVKLRKMNGYLKLAEVLFDENRKEKIQNASFENFTININATFAKFGIKKCIHKIHFLAQTYVESGAFRATYEGLTTVPSNYKGGVDFQGRGIKQITHDYNYLEYYDNVKGTSYFKNKYNEKHKLNEGVTEYMLRVPDPDFGEELLAELKKFAKRLSTEMSTACDSAGWYWGSRGINTLAEKDDVLAVSKKINGSLQNTPNNYEERKKSTKYLKEIFKYEKCINNK